MELLGYACLIERLNLNVWPPEKKACLSGSVNSRVDSSDRILFPRGVAIEDSPVGHLEFALRHEEIRLDIVAETFKGKRSAAPSVNLSPKPPSSAFLRRVGDGGTDHLEPSY